MPHTKENRQPTSLNGSWVRTVTLAPPSLADNTADADRLAHALKKALGTHAVEMDLSLVGRLPHLLRQYDYRVRCTLLRDRGRWLLVGVGGDSDTRPPAGLAVDLGTSRVVLRLLDLADGAILGETAFDNPQIAVGPDVLTRMHFADSDGGLDRLNRLIIDALNRHIAVLCGDCGYAPEQIHLVAVAGNTAMTHLFLRLAPRWMIREPYIPVVNRPGIVWAKALGLTISPDARVIVFPNVGSYFGGDLIAGILFSGLNRSGDTALLVDVGTNAEVVLGNENWLIACAGAAGPALESGVTKMGMMAGPGVIDGVRIDPATGAIDLHVIGEAPPRGICGSGLIDLAAELFLSGMVDIRGKFVTRACGRRLVDRAGLCRFEVVDAAACAAGVPLTVSQTDLDSLIRSKAAMFTILETITAEVGVPMAELAAFYVSGTFGSFIKPASAIAIGMLPDLPLERYVSLGNSSLGGATLALTRPESLTEIDRIRDRITYMELNVNQDFMNRFSAARFLPHTDRGRFPSVKVPAR